MTRRQKLTMPRTGDTILTARQNVRYVLAAQWADRKPAIIQGSIHYDKLTKALEKRLRRPYTWTSTHARPDYAIFDLSTGDVLTRYTGDGQTWEAGR